MRRDNIVADLKADFIKDVDYREDYQEVDSTSDTGSRPLLLKFQKQRSQKKRGGHNKEVISLSIDCFKQFGMMISGDRVVGLPDKGRETSIATQLSSEAQNKLLRGSQLHAHQK